MAKKKSSKKKVAKRKTIRRTAKVDSADGVRVGEEFLEKAIQLDCKGSSIGDIKFSLDGKRALIGNDYTVQLWDAETGRCLRVLKGHTGNVWGAVWSADERRVLSGSYDNTVRLWDVETGCCLRVLKGHTDGVHTPKWSADQQLALTGSRDLTMRLWDVETGRCLRVLKGHAREVISLAWRSVQHRALSGSADNTMRLWDVKAGRCLRVLEGHTNAVTSVVWSADGHKALSGSWDRTVRLWDLETGRCLRVFEGHTAIVCLACSADQRHALSGGWDMTLRLWDVETWRCLCVLEGHADNVITVAWSADGQRAFSSDINGDIRVWDLSKFVSKARAPAVLVPALPPEPEQVQYTNAKVVLVGNTSVGKTGLGIVLAGRRFRATESSHGRHVWMFDEKEIELKPARRGSQSIKSTRETLLWDLAGQPGYRLIHQLHLHEVAVALVLFDSRSETEPFAGVSYWAQALDEATRGFPLVKFLVATRIDRGGIAVSKDRINDVVQKYGFKRFFETSAKRGDGLAKLKEYIRKEIAWDILPTISSTELFRAVKRFLINTKRRGEILAKQTELLKGFRKTKKYTDTSEAVFSTCLGRLEAAKLICRLSFGDYVLLQPEMLDDYCGWLALAARDQPDGLGFLSEDDALKGKFAMDKDRRLKGKSEEKTMLLATIHEIISRHISIRQQTSKGPMVVFPSELCAELPDYPGGYSLAIAFIFQGPVSAIYATLAVTLMYSVPFEKKDLFKNAALFNGPQKEICGFAVEYPDVSDDSAGRLVVFFQADTDRSVRLLFLRYVNEQLKHLAFEGTVERERIYHCEECNETIPPKFVDLRIRKKETTVICPGCGRYYSIDTLAEESDVFVDELDIITSQVSEERERQKRLTILAEREKAMEFHVFLCHNSKDKPFVRQIEQKLRNQGILAWIDEKNILAGDHFPKKLENTIDKAPVMAVILGPHGMGKWQEQEYYAALMRSIEDRDVEGRPNLRLIPVLLPGVKRKPKLPTFMRVLDYIDLRNKGTDNREQISKLVASIMGGSTSAKVVG